MVILREGREPMLKESAQDRSTGHRIGKEICLKFLNQAYRSNADITSLRDSLAGLYDGCNEVILAIIDKNKFRNDRAEDILSRISVALDDSCTELFKLRV